MLSIGDLVLLTGGWDTFKSTISAELAKSLVSSEPLLGHRQLRVQQQLRPVLVIQTEIEPGNFDQRMHAAGLRANPAVAQFMDDYSGPLLLDSQGFEALRNTIAYEHYRALVLDPIGRMWPAYDAPTGRPFEENNKAHTTYVLERLLDLDITTVIVHHDPKPKERGWGARASGSSALLNIPDTRLLVDRDEKDPAWLTIWVRSRNLARLDLGPGHARGGINVWHDGSRLIARPRLDKFGKSMVS